MRILPLAGTLFMLQAVVTLGSGCWNHPFPGHDGDHSGTFMCENQSSRTESSRFVDHRYAGSWTWIQSCGGIAGWCSSPESVGYEQQLYLSPGGSYTMCRNTDTVEEGHYLIEPLDTKNRIHFMKPDRDTVRTLFIELAARDTLLLDEGCCDMFAHLYARD